jgi:hypothetical protein
MKSLYHPRYGREFDHSSANANDIRFNHVNVMTPVCGPSQEPKSL